MSSTIFQNDKTPFQAIKTRSSKLEKLTFFQKGQQMVLFKTWPFFQLFFQAIYAMKISFTIFQNEKTPFKAIKTLSSKSQKINISLKGLTHDLGQKLPFFQLLFQAIQAMKISFTIFQNENTPFQPIKRRSSKTRKIDLFPKGLTHCIGPKMAIFATFLLR